MDISQILYDQYHIWNTLFGIYVLGPKTKVFCRKINQIHVSMSQNSADSSAKNTPNAPKFISPICLPKPKNFDFLKKSSLWMSVVRLKYQ